MDPMSEAAVVKAPGCPHYVTVAQYEDFIQRNPQATARMRCRRCWVKPVVVYGPFDRPGPVQERPRRVSSPPTKGYLRRQLERLNREAS